MFRSDFTPSISSFSSARVSPACLWKWTLRWLNAFYLFLTEDLLPTCHLGEGQFVEPKDTLINKIQIFFLLKPNVVIAIPIQGSVILKWLTLKIYLATPSKFFFLIMFPPLENCSAWWKKDGIWLPYSFSNASVLPVCASHCCNVSNTVWCTATLYCLFSV